MNQSRIYTIKNSLESSLTRKKRWLFCHSYRRKSETTICRRSSSDKMSWSGFSNMELSGLIIPNAMIEDHFEYWYIPFVNSSPMKFYIPFADFFPCRRRQERVLFSLRFSAPHRSVIFYKEEDSITDILCIELIKTRDSGEARPVVVSHIDHGSETLVVELEDGFSEQTETFKFNDGMREKLEICSANERYLSNRSRK